MPVGGQSSQPRGAREGSSALQASDARRTVPSLVTRAGAHNRSSGPAGAEAVQSPRSRPPAPRPKDPPSPPIYVESPIAKPDGFIRSADVDEDLTGDVPLSDKKRDFGRSLGSSPSGQAPSAHPARAARYRRHPVRAGAPPAELAHAARRKARYLPLTLQQLLRDLGSPFPRVTARLGFRQRHAVDH